ncbi:hypothetical protein CY34DRAFT_688242 [Suillus luteus UH-Slu-Lm8-n1]|uniref:Uncharacterized protein n=1 Tax=Suillus luteus UH-Slu-Lm8-n1 TaxID=930992 RepID=A0A0D0A1A0_9AGAM|nr:hypothetical protein CY34DRAFT_688242 [Suillus luteus UH-Slu-Lm8-n1]
MLPNLPSGTTLKQHRPRNFKNLIQGYRNTRTVRVFFSLTHRATTPGPAKPLTHSLKYVEWFISRSSHTCTVPAGIVMHKPSPSLIFVPRHRMSIQ